MNPWDLALVLIGWLVVVIIAAVILIIVYAVVFAIVQSLRRPKRSTRIFKSPGDAEFGSTGR